MSLSQQLFHFVLQCPLTLTVRYVKTGIILVVILNVMHVRLIVSFVAVGLYVRNVQLDIMSIVEISVSKCPIIVTNMILQHSSVPFVTMGSICKMDTVYNAVYKKEQ